MTMMQTRKPSSELPILTSIDTIDGKPLDMIPVYFIPDRTDGKPSINTEEGWEALRRRLMQTKNNDCAMEENGV